MKKRRPVPEGITMRPLEDREGEREGEKDMLPVLETLVDTLVDKEVQ